MRSDHNYQSQHWKRLGARRSVTNRNRCVVPDCSKPFRSSPAASLLIPRRKIPEKIFERGARALRAVLFFRYRR